MWPPWLESLGGATVSSLAPVSVVVDGPRSTHSIGSGRRTYSVRTLPASLVGAMAARIGGPVGLGHGLQATAFALTQAQVGSAMR